MEDKSWVKLYRKAKDNQIMQDQVAFLLFGWILLSVDRKTGTWKIGRYLLSRLTGIKPSTIYKALKRLEKKYKMVTLSSNNRFTEISLSKWAYYQQDGQSVTPLVTTKEQRSNTYQELENKRIEYINWNKNHKRIKKIQENFKKRKSNL